jgi:DNA-binding SARP family transcriptional activator
VEFRVLGPVEATVNGAPLELGGPKERALLAVLLLHANHAVPAAYLIDQLWQDQPPMTAPNLLHGYVSRLRRMLRRSEAGTTPGGIVMTKGQGYLLKLEPGQLDLDRFERLVARARQAMAEAAPQRAAAYLTEALALWHGPALADIPRGPLVDAESARLEACRHAALEARIEADLACGRHSELVGELDALVAGYPTHERFRAQLMLALYRSGRQSEALRVYRDARAVLAEELGLEPGPDLQRLERAILTADPSLAAASEPDRAAAATGPPRQLPPAVTGFTGRQDALASLLGMVRGEPGDGEVAIAVITGKPGVGKTALAVRAAHQLRPRFPDGQLYVDLRGVEPRPLEPSDVLADLLRALEVDGAAIPDGLEQRASLYRTLLADRRVLVVLDNAADEGQVRPLLPGGIGCARRSRRRRSGPRSNARSGPAWNARGRPTRCSARTSAGPVDGSPPSTPAWSPPSSRRTPPASWSSPGSWPSASAATSRSAAGGTTGAGPTWPRSMRPAKAATAMPRRRSFAGLATCTSTRAAGRARSPASTSACRSSASWATAARRRRCCAVWG